MSAIFLDGSIVHYEALGRGRPIVFLHGWVGSWRYWINAMQVASTSFRAYALDFHGYGDTSRDPLKYSLEKQTGLVNNFLDEMGIGKVAIIAHGLGALVGFTFIERWPESVDRIMAVNCPLNYEAINARLKNAATAELIEWLAVPRTPEMTAALADASKADPQAVSVSIAELQANNLFAAIHSHTIPCLLVYGSNDPSLTIPAHENEDSLPLHIHQINLEGTGHFPMLNDATRFNRLLTDFLALDSGISPRELSLKEEWKRRVR